MRAGIAILALLLAVPVAAQEEAEADENPLAVLKSDLVRVLAAADLPFEAEQDRAITLMMEDRLQASESLFGGLMDFRGGPTSGQQAERLQSAIGWLRNEFLTRVSDYLTPEQLAVWNGYRNPIATSSVMTVEGARTQAPQQTQYVRINNNRFTAEELDFQEAQEPSRGTSATTTSSSSAGSSEAIRPRKSSSAAARARGMARCRACSRTMR